MASKVCLVTGVGPATGAAIARKFASDYEVAMVARSTDRLKGFAAESERLHAYPCDISDLESLEKTYLQVQSDLQPPDVIVHNAVYGLFGTFDKVKVKQFERAFRLNASTLLRLAQLAAPKMVERQNGAIAITGNTAAYRGVPNFAGFAPSKAAQRILAESLARTLGPSGIHVAYIAIDAVIATPGMRKAMADKPVEFFANPDDIAQHVWDVVHQPKSTWSFDSVIRPYGESW